jgi:hypothetical protein
VATKPIISSNDVFRPTDDLSFLQHTSWVEDNNTEYKDNYVQNSTDSSFWKYPFQYQSNDTDDQLSYRESTY